MTGWKTKGGGYGLIVTGIGTCIAALVAGPPDIFAPNWEIFGGGIATIAFGHGTLGIGHKVEKAGS